ncbi:MAG: methyltransferase domain-containing protein [Micromonosporaceae bacterium]|nr:methyltransferase domain-containing protein [Micromonosporaceae bacterium]
MKHLEPGSPRAFSFGPAAERYDQLRPSYPEAALRWAVGDRPGLRVVDLGAGTGIVTRSLLGLGHEVVPVEPDPAMRERLAATAPEVYPLAGFAEQIPLPDTSVDAVVAGQAYHWFDRDPAHAEVARVLRPGGTFAAIWNIRDESVSWVAELSTITDDDTAGRGLREPTPAVESFGPAFGPVARATFGHTTEHTPDTLVGLIATRSYYLTATPARQRELERRVRELCARHPDLAGRDRFPLPYRTEVYRAEAVRGAG